MKINLNRNIYNKLLAVCLFLLIVPSLLIGYQSYIKAKGELDDKGRIILKNSVKQAIQMIEEKQKEVEKGNITVEQAQEDVKIFLLGEKNTDGTRPINKSIDLGENGYFFVFDEKATEIAHPSIEGQNVWDAKDKGGKDYYFARDIVNKGKNGGGFVKYSWELPNSKAIAPKITYSEQENEWGWIICAGTYEKDFNDGANDILMIVGITLVATLIGGTIIILLFARHISKPLNIIKNAVEKVAQGDLTIKEVKIKNNDETGALANSFNQMVYNLKNLLNTVKASTDTVSKSSISLNDITNQTARATDEIAHTISEVAESSTQQASDIEGGNIQMNELGKAIESVAIMTDDMQRVSEETTGLTKKGLETVQLLSQKTEENNKAAFKVNEVVVTLNDNSQEIGRITDAISQIAEQTNLLALNASIEAARAGEAGKGFSVVADEIRKLAQGASRSVGEINEILSTIQSNSKVAVDSMTQAKGIVDEQSTAVKDTKEIFDEISNALADLVTKIAKVTTSSIEMNNNKENVINMIENLSAISEQTAAATQQVSAATEEQSASVQEVAGYAEELKNISNGLTEVVNKFKI